MSSGLSVVKCQPSVELFVVIPIQSDDSQCSSRSCPISRLVCPDLPVGLPVRLSLLIGRSALPSLPVVWPTSPGLPIRRPTYLGVLISLIHQHFRRVTFPVQSGQLIHSLMDRHAQVYVLMPLLNLVIDWMRLIAHLQLLVDPLSSLVVPTSHLQMLRLPVSCLLLLWVRLTTQGCLVRVQSLVPPVMGDFSLGSSPVWGLENFLQDF